MHKNVNWSTLLAKFKIQTAVKESCVATTCGYEGGY
jgi:hypothetical protein